VLGEAVNYYFISMYLTILTFAKTSDNNRHEASSESVGGLEASLAVDAQASVV